MKKLLCTVLTSSLVFGLGLVPLKAESAKEQLDDAAQRVNQEAKKVGESVALQRVSTETGVPLGKVEAMKKDHSHQGPADLLLACVMADETKKSPAKFLDRHVEHDKNWTAIAKENNVPVEKLIARLDRLERNLTPTSSDSRVKEEKDQNKRDKGAH